MITRGVNSTMDHKPKCLIIEGARNSGKTTLAKMLCAQYSNLFYYVKFSNFQLEISHPSFSSYASPLRQDMLLSFLEQSPGEWPLPVFDRMIGTDLVMNKVLHRKQKLAALKIIEQRWASLPTQQIFLKCDWRIRENRADKIDEGPRVEIDFEFNQWLEKTPIATRVIDSASPFTNELVESIILPLIGL